MFPEWLEPSIMPFLTGAKEEDIKNCIDEHKEYQKFQGDFTEWLVNPSQELKEKVFGKDNGENKWEN